ncbi:hypothetical protein SODALDRAFT_361443 [Sodiomyces alkalinus F11]|uniref:Uncharacterized protein n=1 Tax=Sodiomyces alkalinus (strain CBS 110278 / VKM F-3762 / F11) TaxID=1314773 RepID=A0A3N2PTA5_SODAK|nr:hypothetical protein SODALDRAFT_361443 [Sodiomyces alkalinus F11]ROT37711.1 hypothetical protein SODALDRAFT_361443 [Sodiomyces alkalinus F11]
MRKLQWVWFIRSASAVCMQQGYSLVSTSCLTTWRLSIRRFFAALAVGIPALSAVPVVGSESILIYMLFRTVLLSVLRDHHRLDDRRCMSSLAAKRRGLQVSCIGVMYGACNVDVDGQQDIAARQYQVWDHLLQLLRHALLEYFMKTGDLDNITSDKPPLPSGMRLFLRGDNSVLSLIMHDIPGGQSTYATISAQGLSRMVYPHRRNTKTKAVWSLNQSSGWKRNHERNCQPTAGVAADKRNEFFRQGERLEVSTNVGREAKLWTDRRYRPLGEAKWTKCASTGTGTSLPQPSPAFPGLSAIAKELRQGTGHVKRRLA